MVAEFKNSFTGAQLVATVAELLPVTYVGNLQVALGICRLLHQPTYMYEVEGSDVVLCDTSEQLFSFTSNSEDAGYDYLVSSSHMAQPRYTMNFSQSSASAGEELPKAVLTRFTRCYSPFCGIEGTPSTYRCYSLYCPSGENPVSEPLRVSGLQV